MAREVIELEAHLRITDCHSECLPVSYRTLPLGCMDEHPSFCELTLFRLQELAVMRPVWENEDGGHGNADSDDSLCIHQAALASHVDVEVALLLPIRNNQRHPRIPPTPSQLWMTIPARTPEKAEDKVEAL